MKNMKKIGAIALAMVLALALCVPALAATSADADGFSIMIQKSDKAVSFAGQTFNAYKIFDVTYSGTSYSYKIIDALKNLTFEGRSGQDLIDYLATLTNDSTKMSEFTAEAVKFVSNSSNGIDPVMTVKITDDADFVTINVTESGAGYYLVTGTVKADDDTSATPETVITCGLTTTNPNATVNVKTDLPTLDKNIVVESADGDVTETKTDTASVGDTVKFKVESVVPNMNGYKQYFYVVTDTMSAGLTFNDDVVVKMGSDVLDSTAYNVETAEGVNGATVIKIYFVNFIQYLDKKGDDVVITYSATVNEDAQIGTDPNTNKAILEFTNDPTKDLSGDPDTGKPDPNDPHGTTPESTTETFVTAIELLKYDGADSSKSTLLAGAEFTLTGESINKVKVSKEVFTEDANGSYWKLVNGKYTTEDPNAEGMDKSKYEDVNTRYKKETVTEWQTQSESVTITGTTDANGILTFSGLGEGTYTLTEITAPNGFNKLDTPIVLEVKYENGAWVVVEKINGETVSGDEAAIIEGGVVKLDVENNSGSLLPSTGGIGTTIFYVVGGILVIGAVILLVTRKRVSDEV